MTRWACSVSAAFLAAIAPAVVAAQESPPSPLVEGPAAGVVRLPWADFRQLVEQLRTLQTTLPGQEPPVDSVVAGTVYRVTVDAEQRRAAVAGEIDLAVLRENRWLEIPLLPDTAALESLTLDGRPATVTQRDGLYRLIVHSGTGFYGYSGARKVALSYRVNVTADGGPHSVTLPLVEAAITRIEVTVPRTDQDVRIVPDGAILERSVTPEATRVTALVPPTLSATISWSDKAAPVQEEPLRAVAEAVHRVSFGRQVASGEVAVRVEVQRGSFEAIALRFPKEVEGIRVDDDFQVDTAQGPDGAQIATVRMGYARREETTIVLRYEIQRSAGRIVPPDVKVVKLVQEGQDRELVRQSGFLVLLADEGIEVVPDGPPTGAEPCDTTEVPGATRLAGTPVTAFRTSGLPQAVPVAVTRHEERPVLACAARYARLALVVNEQGKTVGSLTLDVQNNERQFIGVELPAGATLWATFVGGRPVKPSGEDAWVMIPVPHSEIGYDGAAIPFAIEVIYYQELPRIEGIWGSGAFSAPRADILIRSYDVSVWVPPGFRYFDFDGSAEPAVSSVGPALDLAPPVTVASGFGPGGQAEGHRFRSPEPETSPLPAEAPADEFYGEDSKDGAETTSGTAGVTDEENRLGANVRGAASAGEALAGKSAEAERPGPAARATRGLLPIRIDVAPSGLVLSFSRSIVKEREATEVGFRYQSRGLTASFPWLAVLAGLLLALPLARMLHRSARVGRLSIGSASPAVFVCGVALIVLMKAVLVAPVGRTAWAALATAAAYGAVLGGVWLVRFLQMRRDRPAPPAPAGPEGAAGPDGPPPPPPESPPAASEPAAREATGPEREVAS